jgi:methionyl-tRNA formyltransferase
MRIVFMGTPEFAATPLEFLMLNRAGVVAVYTQPDKEAGRGRALVAPPVKTIALKYGIPVYQPANLKSVEERDKLTALKPDIIVVAAFGQILPQPVLELPRYGCLNIHPSLLPKYRGVSPVPAAILNGDEFTGVSVMILDKGVDTGPILVQAQTSIKGWDTTGSLTEKLSRIGAQLLLEILPRWVEGQVTPQTQDNAQATYTRMIDKEAGGIEWHQPAVELWRQVRAYHPWPGSYTQWQGKQLKIIEAVPLEGQSGIPGRVVTLAGDVAFGVETGAGILGVVRVQMEGKRAMMAGEFLRGQRQLTGAVLPGN